MPTQRPWRVVHSESSPEWGGQEHRIMAELAGFRRRGCAVALLTLNWARIFQHAAEQGLATRTFSSARWQYPWAVARCALWLRRFRPQVLNTHSSRDAWIAGMAGRIARVPFIVRTRHFDVAVPNPRLSRVVYETLADHVITTSPKVTAHFRELFGWPAERITTLPTGVDTARFTPDGPAAELGPPRPSAALPRIGMVGVLRGAKSHDTFLDAVKKLRETGFEARYCIAGEGPQRTSIEERIRELQLEAVVMLTGHRDDVPALLRALDLVVIPSRHEGVPQVGLQALATEIPVVGSNVGGIPEIIRPGETGRLFPAGDSAALADAMRQVFADRAATTVMAKRGRALVEAHYSVEAMLDQLDALYARCVPK